MANKEATIDSSRPFRQRLPGISPSPNNGKHINQQNPPILELGWKQNLPETRQKESVRRFQAIQRFFVKVRGVQQLAPNAPKPLKDD